MKWAPEVSAKAKMIAIKMPTVAVELARSCRPTSSVSRSAMMPDPTTPARRKAVPMNSARNALTGFGATSFSLTVER